MTEGGRVKRGEEKPSPPGVACSVVVDAAGLWVVELRGCGSWAWSKSRDLRPGLTGERFRGPGKIYFLKAICKADYNGRE